MKKFNINWEPIGKFAKTAFEVVVYGALAAASIKYSESVTKTYSTTNTATTYSDAVAAIMDSDMYSHYKTDAIALLKRDGTADYYKAVARVVGDDSMYSHYKIDMIKTLSEE